MIQQLLRRGYDSDPLKAWKAAQDKLQDEEEDDIDDSESMTSSASGDGPDYNYLLGMQLWSLTKEKKEQLLKQKEEKVLPENIDKMVKTTSGNHIQFKFSNHGQHDSDHEAWFWSVVNN